MNMDLKEKNLILSYPESRKLFHTIITRLAMGAKIKATGEIKLNDSPG